MVKQNDYAFNGQVEERDPNAHQADPRGVLRKSSNGLTKREYFAAAAMQALASNHKYTDASAELGKSKSETISDISEQAVSMADALIKELAK